MSERDTKNLNIFFLHRDPSFAARYHNDRHVDKQIAETTEILTWAHYKLDGASNVVKTATERVVLVEKHETHPCVAWAAKCSANYRWVSNLASALVRESELRFGKLNRFGLQNPLVEIVQLLKTLPANIVESQFLTVPPQWMPDEFKTKREDLPFKDTTDLSAAIFAYREFYFADKKHLAIWSKPSDVPPWWKKMERRDILNRSVAT